MDPRRVLTFRAVAHARSFTAAARALALTQPAVSQQVAALETELGAPLLDREPGGMELTPAGEVLLAHADASPSGSRWRERQIAELRRRPGRLRIGAFSSSLAGLVPRAGRAAARERSPRRRGRSSEEGDSAALAERVLRRRAAPEPRVPGRGAAAARARGPRAPRRAARAVPRRRRARAPARRPRGRSSSPSSPSDPWSAASTDGLIARACRAAGFVPRIVAIARDPIAIREFVARGTAVTLVPRLLAPAMLGARVPRRSPAAPQRDVYVLLPPGGRHPLVDDALARALRSSLRAGVNGRLLITCPDRHGIVAAVAGFLAALRREHHHLRPALDRPRGRRVLHADGVHARARRPRLARPRVRSRRSPTRLDMRWRLTDAGRPKRDGGARLQGGPLPRRPAVAPPPRRARRRDRARRLQPPGPPGRRRGLRHPLPPRPVSRNEPELLELLRDVDLVVLARYMQHPLGRLPRRRSASR